MAGLETKGNYVRCLLIVVIFMVLVEAKRYHVRGEGGGRKVVKSSFMESTHKREPIFMVEVTSLDTIMEVPTI